MSDDELAIGIAEAASRVVTRFAQHVTDEDKMNGALAEYMSGAAQAVNFLIRAEGEVTPQQMERALAIVGKKLGLIPGAS